MYDDINKKYNYTATMQVSSNEAYFMLIIHNVNIVMGDGYIPSPFIVN